MDEETALEREVTSVGHTFLVVLPPNPRLTPCQVPAPSPEAELKEKGL